MKWDFKSFIISAFLGIFMLGILSAESVFTGLTATGINLNFTPKSLSGLVAWYAPESDIIIDATGTATVSSWGDLSGNGNTVTQGTKANQPGYGITNSLNGFPTLRFAGSHRLLAGNTSITNLTNGSDVPYSGFCVVLEDTLANEVSFGWGNSTNTTPSAVHRPTVTSTYRSSRSDDGGTVVNASSGTSSSSNLIWQIQGYSFSGTTAIMRCNAFTSSPSHNVGNITLNTFAIGAYSRNGGFANSITGNIVEVVIYNRQLSQDEFNQVVKYLNSKYLVF